MERAGISGEVAKKISGHKTDDSAYRRYDIVDNWDIENAGKKPEEFLKVRLERERKEAQAANAAVKKPPATAKSQKVKKTHSA
jgi:hypothetical protein